MQRILPKLALGVIFCVGLGFWLAPYFAGAKFLNPMLVDFGNFRVYWYGALMALGVIVAYLVTSQYANKFFRFDPDTVLTAAIWAMAGGIVGARLLFVILKWSLYASDPSQILAYNQGGLSIHGAILGGLAGLVIYSLIIKKPWLELAGLFSLGLVSGQIIGRFGNFFNSEAFGGPTNLPWKMFVAPEFRPSGLADISFFHPTFLYEAIGLVLIFWFLSRVSAHQRTQLFVWYLVLYSSLRFVIEFYRIDSDVWGALTVAQWASVAIIVVGGWWLSQFKRIKL